MLKHNLLREKKIFKINIFFSLLLFIFLSCFYAPTKPDENLFNLQISEINYNPPACSLFTSDLLEFIEIRNNSNKILDLGTIEIRGGIDYSFPKNATIDPYGFYVIASDDAGFKYRYGFLPDGVYSGKLRNSSDTIIIIDALTNTELIRVEYCDTNGWPTEADGNGYTLVPVEINASQKGVIGANRWRRSVKLYGSPNEDDILEEIEQSLFDLRITEIHYHPFDPDTFDGDSLEFIEIKNTGSKDIHLKNVAFTKGIYYQFSDTSQLKAGDFIVLASNRDEFRRRYDFAPYDCYTGQLGNAGELIRLEHLTSLTVLCEIEYKDGLPWPEEADGKGYSIVPIKKNPEKIQNDPFSWRKSFKLHGSPGKDDPNIVYINEIMSNPDAGKDDFIEIHNPCDDSVDISGWFLTDSKVEPLKFRIPDGTIIPPDGYLVFYEDDFSNFFRLNSHGDDIYIMSDSGGCTKGYCHGFKFDASEVGISSGRYVNSVGKEFFVAQKSTSEGKENSGAKIGPIVISEIGFNYLDSSIIFIEFYNIGLQEVRLYDPEYYKNTWKISGMCNFSFPESISIKTREYMVVVAEGVKLNLNIPEDVKTLHVNMIKNNNTKKISLSKPGEPYIDSLVSTSVPIVPYIIVEEIELSDGELWPQINETYFSLQRKVLSNFANDPGNYLKDAPPTPGRPNGISQ